MTERTHQIPEQKENARHGEQMFPLTKYITALDDFHPPVFAHWHEEAEFTLVTEGSGTYQIQLETYEVKEGDLLFIPPAVLHSITAPSGGHMLTETYVFHMHFLGMHAADICAVRYLTPIASQKLLPPVYFGANHPLQNELRGLFLDLNAVYDTKETGYELLLKADFLKLISLLLPYCTESSTQPQLHSEHTAKLKIVLEYIDLHYTEELSIAQLAALCYFSEYHFMRFFKKYVGMSCLDYIKNLRLEKAVELLEDGNLSTLEVSLSVGFHNLSYFHREFKKKYGMTPKNFATHRGTLSF